MRHSEMKGIRYEFFDEYRTYCQIKYRCNTKTAHNYSNYGGRNIKCLFDTFESFLDVVGPRPSKQHSIERLDNNGNYEINNVVWATRTKQRNNQRQYSLRSDNTSGIPGVSLQNNAWRTRVWKNKKELLLYYGPSKQEAINAKINWEKQLCQSY